MSGCSKRVVTTITPRVFFLLCSSLYFPGLCFSYLPCAPTSDLGPFRWCQHWQREGRKSLQKRARTYESRDQEPSAVWITAGGEPVPRPQTHFLPSFPLCALLVAGILRRICTRYRTAAPAWPTHLGVLVADSYLAGHCVLGEKKGHFEVSPLLLLLAASASSRVRPPVEGHLCLARVEYGKRAGLSAEGGVLSGGGRLQSTMYPLGIFRYSFSFCFLHGSWVTLTPAQFPPQ